MFFLAGFDPIDVPSQYRRFRREIAKSARTWSVTAATSGLEDGRWRLTAAGPNWATETLYEPLDWHDAVAAELDSPRIAQLWHGLAAFLDFVVSGTAYRYFKASWQYGLFFLQPFLAVLLFVLAAAAAGLVAWRMLPLPPPATPIVAVAIAVAVFVVLMRWPGRRWSVEQALADWIFARDYMYGRRPDIAARLDGFADRIVARARRNDCEEIVVVGHSLGATLAVEALDRAFARDPDLARHGPALCLLTVGATIPKLTLHPAAAKLRAAVARVAQAPGLAWTEYQARRDPISFYRFDPVTLAPAGDNVPGRNPCIRLVGIKDMMEPEAYERRKFRYMRLHYQFVMGNERRASYDYVMLIGGPAPFAELAALPGGVLDAYGDDGAYRKRTP